MRAPSGVPGRSGFVLLPVTRRGNATSTRSCRRRDGVYGVAGDAGGWHRRGARRSDAADSVHCQPYAKPRVECPRWVGLTEGAAPSACRDNNCRDEGARPFEPQFTGRRPFDPCARPATHPSTRQLSTHPTSDLDLSPPPAGGIAPSYGDTCPTLRRWCCSGRHLSSTPGPRRPLAAPIFLSSGESAPVSHASLHPGMPPATRHRPDRLAGAATVIGVAAGRIWGRRKFAAGPTRCLVPTGLHFPASRARATATATANATAVTAGRSRRTA